MSPKVHASVLAYRCSENHIPACLFSLSEKECWSSDSWGQNNATHMLMQLLDSKICVHTQIGDLKTERSVFHRTL